ncbi:hypothetical protein [Staphylococcus capitis]|uniref:hypothetical protein n=1 Tax=Staphylococcus capitis TaxID=29388 RepID=UPI001BCA6BAA|nr:hypothetical protein [Staphylococcus capitis]
MNDLKKYIICLISLIPIEFVCLIVDYKKGISLFYILLVVISIGIGLFIKNYKSYILVLISRLIGTILSVICSHLFINTYASSGYFKPFTAFGYAIFLGIISQILILITIGLIYVFKPRRK